jgi:hypothetical protein
MVYLSTLHSRYYIQHVTKLPAASHHTSFAFTVLQPQPAPCSKKSESTPLITPRLPPDIALA